MGKSRSLQIGPNSNHQRSREFACFTLFAGCSYRDTIKVNNMLTCLREQAYDPLKVPPGKSSRRTKHHSHKGTEQETFDRKCLSNILPCGKGPMETCIVRLIAASEPTFN